MSAKKQRLDVLLVEKGLFPSREKARAAVMAGLVFAGGERADKPGRLFGEDVELEVRGKPSLYVSRGGLKLEKAIREFDINLEGKTVLDVGASTGGFTDCALQHGARMVYAVDVGYGQLDWRLRNHPRVIVMERTNIRHVSPEVFLETPDFAVVDVSFISCSLVLPVVGELLAPGSSGVVLIKPQFEAGREMVGKKGVVKDKQVHIDVIEKIMSLIKTLGWTAGGLDYSPLKGPEGNIEFLLFFKLNGVWLPIDFNSVVELAHAALS
ncbi:MAG: TlyA family RNA methyltransferase [Eubacteriales bacterium]